VATLAVSAVGIDRPGIAAPQIGELVRIVVVDCSPHPKAEPTTASWCSLTR
jgi:peptide deformylase